MSRTILAWISLVAIFIGITGFLFFSVGCHDHDTNIYHDDTIVVEHHSRHFIPEQDEFETVFVFKARGGRGKPPVEETCLDTNLNETFEELGVRLPTGGMFVEYHPIFEPDFLAFEAVERGFDSWETAVDDLSLFDFAYVPDGVAGPERDGVNTVGWRRFVGPGGDFLAAAFVTDNGAEILEVDIFFNLKHKWSVTSAIEPGSMVCGDQFDIQAVSAHEIGHMLGLGHVESGSDATMAPSAAKGELMKQTLTPGDVVGAETVVPIPLTL